MADGYVQELSAVNSCECRVFRRRHLLHAGTCKSRRDERGVNVNDIQKSIGHSTKVVVERRLAH
jgi:hypothetical protein